MSLFIKSEEIYDPQSKNKNKNKNKNENENKRIYSLDDNIPLYSIFVLILIISAGFIPELFPCAMQRLLKENIYLKHLFCFLTLTFFVILTDPIKEQPILNVIKKSIILYLIFLFAIKTHYYFFIIIIIISGMLYISMLHRYNKEKILNEEKNKYIKENLKKDVNNIIFRNNILFGIIIFLIIVGFLIYLGQKKVEYKKKFSYITFLFGKHLCGNIYSKEISYWDSIKYAFTK
jgi:hypothetical protein